MSRSEARLKATSSPPSRMRPEVGNSRPAIMRKVVVLPQPEGPSRQKKEPSGMVKLSSFTAMKSPKAFFRFSTRISAIGLLRKFRYDDEHESSRQHGGEGIGVERQRQRLQQH